jgi:hypothetical protein
MAKTRTLKTVTRGDEMRGQAKHSSLILEEVREAHTGQRGIDDHPTPSGVIQLEPRKLPHNSCFLQPHGLAHQPP